METMFSPWRSQYISSFADEEKQDPDSCFLCEAAWTPEKDAELLVVARAQHCFVIMNRFPYNGGHVLVAPYRHTGELTELLPEELADIMNSLQAVVRALTDVFAPHGFNIGANLGRVAGAGVPGHIHFHVVPRWNGDTNFMPVLAEIKVVSESLGELRGKLADAFGKGRT